MQLNNQHCLHWLKWSPTRLLSTLPWEQGLCGSVQAALLLAHHGEWQANDRESSHEHAWTSLFLQHWQQDPIKTLHRFLKSERKHCLLEQQCHAFNPCPPLVTINYKREDAWLTWSCTDFLPVSCANKRTASTTLANGVRKGLKLTDKQ